MVTFSNCALPGKAGRYLALLSLAIPVVVLYTLWYAVNSDQDDVNPILTQLIPAGHCACQTSTVFECSSCLEPHFSDVNTSATDDWTFEYGRDDRNAGLSDPQCAASFPGLFEDVERGERFWNEKGNISISELDEIELQNGMTRAMIYNGDLYIIATKSKGEDHRRKAIATLSAMHRALAAMPSRHLAPKLEFVLSVEDKASDVITGTGHSPLWTFARKASETSLFLIPDFGFWAWDNMIGKMNNQIGSYDDVVEKAKDVERGVSFADKQAKLVWRGKLSFAPKLRRTLLEISRGHEWDDVKQLNWDVRENYMALEDHCKYQYIAHVEGRSYSASLKYRQACNSVIVAHKLQYIQHHHYLLSSHGPTQNYVEVERDFSDLPEKMAHLLANPAEAQRIADNSVKTFRERYLTPAAEACYWRKLWNAYANVSETPELYVHTTEGKKKRGLRFEAFALLGSEEMYDLRTV